ncbi:GAF and ANTAR domain-containing protein [Pseudonocardia xishanensis]|uniref:GAF domain-containing protein n=1 Tax=Pseudonocardia xishanensis TaxID=630995 RepID=A0ABP8RTB1_9PSEU
MADRGAVTAVVARLAAEDLAEEDLARVVCEACVAGLDVDGAAISVLPTEPSRRTLWATDETALALEDLQFTLNEGVCLEAATSGVPVAVPDLTEAARLARWPVFGVEVSARTPARALYALPLQWGAVTIGVLDLYRLRAGDFTTAQWRDLLGVAQTTSMLLLSRRTRPRPPGPADDVAGAVGNGRGHPGNGVDGLSDGVFGNPEIHQAVGMVLAQLGIGPEEALTRMRARAFIEQRMLIDVAHDVVARRVVFTEEIG